MALVFAKSRETVDGDRRIVEGSITFTGNTSYATGGIATSVADYPGLSTLEAVTVVGAAGGSARFDHVASKLVLNVAAGTEVTNSGDPTGFTLKVRARGIA